MKPIRTTRAAATLSALMLASITAKGQFNPIALTPESYTHDMIVEAVGTTPPLPRGYYTTASMDGGANNNGNTWNEQGYFSANPTVGIPPAGTTVVSAADATHSYQFAPNYTQPNALMINATTFRNSTATLVTPAAYTSLSFLTSGGNGGCTFRWTVTHQDGSTETGTASSPDWFNGQNPAWTANGRVDAQTYVLNNLNSGNPRLYSRTVALTGTSPVTKIDIEYVSSANNAHSTIMAISGQTAAGGNYEPVAFTGYNADIVVEEAAPERVNLAPLGYTTASMDAGPSNTGNTWYEVGYAFNAPATGLPAAGSTVTATVRDVAHNYQMAPTYTAPNAAFLNSALNLAALIPQTPAAYTGLSFLGAASGGAGAVEYIVTHQDGSTQEGLLSFPDWFNQNPVVVTAAGRVNNDNAVLDAVNTTNPRLYAVDVALANTTSPVTRVDLTWAGAANRAAIFALSGSQTALAPFFITQPAAVKVRVGDTGTFTATVSGTAPLTLQWQRGAGGTFTDITDGPNISGAQTTTLTVSNAQQADGQDYRLVVSNAQGSATSAVVPLVVLSPLPPLTAAAASITGFGGTWPDAESPAMAMDGTTSKYLNRGATGGANPFTGPVGFVVSPTEGRTVVQAMHFYTANDADARDPMDYKLEGSDDGANWTLISQGPLSLPLGRNGGGQQLDPLTQNMQQVLFNNTEAYTTYRVSFNTVRNPTGGLFQIGEARLLGTVDASGRPFFTAQPTSVVGQVGGSVQLTATASGNPAPAIQWFRSVNGGEFQALADGPNVSGSQTGTLTLSGLAINDSAQFRAVASNTQGTANSSTVNVTVLSALTDITSPTDIVEAIGDEGGGFHGGAANPVNIIDDTTTKYINAGSGFSATAGFPPFQGPVGVTIFPGAGASVVKALRVYTADGNPERDPINYRLEGSNDETTYTLISQGELALPDRRNAVAQQLNPLTHALQEVAINNNSSYTSYKLTFQNVRSENTANSMQVAEIELLGSLGATGPTLSIQYASGSITITWPGGGTLESITDLNQVGNPAAWTQHGTSGTYTEQATATVKVFRVRQ